MNARKLAAGVAGPWLTVWMAVFVLIAGSVGFVRVELDQELEMAQAAMERELQLLASSIHKALRLGNYQDTFDTLKAWGTAHADIVSLHLTAENGFVISEYERLSPAARSLFREIPIDYSYDQRAFLGMRVDLAGLAQSRTRLIAQVGFALVFTASMLAALAYFSMRHRHEALRLQQLATERERANRALSEEIQQRRNVERERDRLASLFEATTDLVGVTDPAGNLLYLNRAARRFAGIQDEATTPLNFAAFHPPWALRRVTQEGIPTAIRHGSWSGETALLDADGKEIPVSQVILSHKDEHGNVLYLSTIVRDMSEHKRVEEALRARTAQLQSIINNAPVMLWSCDRRGLITLSEGRGLESLGLKPGETVGKSVGEVYENAPELLTAVHQALEGQQAVAYPRIRGRLFEAHCAPAWGSTGHIQGVIGVCVDTTERYEGEEKLRAGEVSLREQKRLLAEAQAIAHLGNWSNDLITGRSIWSDETFRLLGLEPGGIEPNFEVFAARLHPEDRETVMATIQRARDPAVRHPYRIEYRLLTPLGERYVEECGQASFDATGRAVRLFGTTMDITARKQAERELERHRQHLEELVAERTAALRAVNAELSAFSYSVSHDLRAPLRAIHGFSKILLDDYSDKLDAEGRSHLMRVCSAAERMGGLIDDLLELSIVGRTALNIGCVDLTALAQEVTEQLQASEPQRKIEVHIARDLSAFADPRLIRLVLQNLLGNAWKYTRRTEQPRIELTGRYDEHEVVFQVRDNGVGFDMAHADKLFRPFQRLHRSSEFEGTGVGLAIVARILLRHGGHAWADSVLGRGATFYFALPREKGGSAKGPVL